MHGILLFCFENFDKWNFQLPEFADAFFENEAQDREKYKGFTHKDDRFKVGGEAKLTKPIGDDEDGQNNQPVIMKKKKFGGQVRKRFDN